MEEEAKRSGHPGWTNQITCTFLDCVLLAFMVCLWESSPGELMTQTSHGNPVLHDLGNLSICSVPVCPQRVSLGAPFPLALRTSYPISGVQCKMKMQGSLLKIIKKFKMVTAEH